MSTTCNRSESGVLTSAQHIASRVLAFAFIDVIMSYFFSVSDLAIKFISKMAEIL